MPAARWKNEQNKIRAQGIRDDRRHRGANPAINRYERQIKHNINKSSDHVAPQGYSGEAVRNKRLGDHYSEKHGWASPHMYFQYVNGPLKRTSIQKDNDEICRDAYQQRNQHTAPKGQYIGFSLET